MDAVKVARCKICGDAYNKKTLVAGVCPACLKRKV
jgi:predicted Zn-ribbon and HTH transcriptional regulator